MTEKAGYMEEKAKAAGLEPARLGRRPRSTPPPAPAPPAPEPPGEPEEAGELVPIAVVAPGDRLDLNAASFEELREIGMSVTQSNRVLAYRERLGGYTSVDDLDAVPGFPRNFLSGLKAKLKA